MKDNFGFFFVCDTFGVLKIFQMSDDERGGSYTFSKD